MPEPLRLLPSRLVGARLVVAPSLLAEVGRKLDALLGSLELTAAHLAGPRPAPALGDPTCGLAYQSAAHQLAGLVTTTTERQRALARSMAMAATLYEVLDGRQVRR